MPLQWMSVFALTRSAIVGLMGVGLAVYLCTPQERGDTWSPGQVIAAGVGGIVATALVMFLVSLASTVAGVKDVARQGQENPGAPITSPAWMGTRVKLGTALAHVAYAFLGFALGGIVAAVLRALDT
jgi:hypothetical protein